MSHQPPEKPQSSQSDTALNCPAQLVAPLFAPTGLASSVGLPMLAWDDSGLACAWNQAAQEIFGYTAGEMIGQSVYQLAPPEMTASIRQIIRELFRYGRPVHNTNPNLTKDGRLLLCEWRNAPMRDATGRILVGVSIVRDLTRQRHMEREREHLQTIAAAANAPADLDEILLLVRSGFLTLGGFDRASIWLINGEAIQGTWGTDELGNVTDERGYRHTLRTYKLAEFRAMHGGQIYFINRSNIYITPQLDLIPTPEPIDIAGIALRVQGEMIGVIYFDNLITRRPICVSDIEEVAPFAEQAAVAIANARLLIERERLITRRRHLLETATAINANLSMDDIFLLVRDAVVGSGDFDRAGVFLIERDEVKATWGTDEQGGRFAAHHLTWRLEDWQDVTAPFASPALKYLLMRPGSFPEKWMPENTEKAVIPFRAGGDLIGLLIVDNLMSGRPLREDDVALLLGLTEQAAAAIRNIRLIAELRQMQEALLRSEKLRAVGELASGVAHNVNNVLAAVLGYAELIQDADNVSAEVCQFARTIERAAMDGAEIVRRVQSFARRETESLNFTFDLCQITQEAIDLTRPAWRNQAESRGVRIEIIPILTSETRVPGVASEIREVLVNLIRNAVDAMPEGGVMTIRCETENGMAQVSIADTGMGMDEATRLRVFEPFFTTKGVGLGTGLGLSVAWGILDRHKGRIEVESKPGHGSLFRIHLPLSRAAAPPPTVTEASLSLEGRCILLVEDEAFVLEGLARTLVARKASVQMAENAAEALEWLETHADACDIVISDHGMIGMTGLQLLKYIAEQYPAIRRVLISGWGASPPGGISTDSAEQILSKPVRAEALIATLAPLTRRTSKSEQIETQEIL